MTKHELSQLYHLKKEIADEQKRLVQLEAAATSITSAMSGLSYSGTISDKTGLAADIADCRNIIIAKQCVATAECNRIMRYIAGVKDSFMRRILEARYIDGLSWQGVANKIGGNNTADSVRMAHNRFLRTQ